jgi:hypothetical protein
MPFKNPHPLYKTWINMKSRCNNSNWPAYHRYGGRGIKICAEWEYDFHQFAQDMGPKPTSKHTLERRDNDKGYSLANCYWATRQIQNRNQSWTRKIVIDGIEYIASELSEKYGVKTDLIVKRAKKGLPFGYVVTRKSFAACWKGHPLVPENTYTYPDGTRKCKICAKTSQMKYRERHGLPQCWSTPILVEMLDAP